LRMYGSTAALSFHQPAGRVTVVTNAGSVVMAVALKLEPDTERDQPGPDHDAGHEPGARARHEGDQSDQRDDHRGVSAAFAAGTAVSMPRPGVNSTRLEMNAGTS